MDVSGYQLIRAFQEMAEKLDHIGDTIVFAGFGISIALFMGLTMIASAIKEHNEDYDDTEDEDTPVASGQSTPHND